MSTKLIDGQKYEVKDILGYGACLVPVKEPTLWELFEEEFSRVKDWNTLDVLLKKYTVRFKESTYNGIVMFTLDNNNKVQIYFTWTDKPCYMEHRPGLDISYLKIWCVVIKNVKAIK